MINKKLAYQRKVKALRLAMQALQRSDIVMLNPIKPYKLVDLDATSIKPDTQLEWRTQGEDSYCNEFTNFETKE